MKVAFMVKQHFLMFFINGVNNHIHNKRTVNNNDSTKKV